jgi:hypothetical protein
MNVLFGNLARHPVRPAVVVAPTVKRYFVPNVSPKNALAKMQDLQPRQPIQYAFVARQPAKDCSRSALPARAHLHALPEIVAQTFRRMQHKKQQQATHVQLIISAAIIFSVLRAAAVRLRQRIKRSLCVGKHSHENTVPQKLALEFLGQL